VKQLLISSYTRIKETNIIANFLNLSSIQLSNILLLILIFPIITHQIGIEAFGFVMLANTFSVLTGTVINYGTNQTGIRDVAAHVKDRARLQSVFYNTLWIRLFLFITYLVLLFVLQWFSIQYYTFILFSLPLVMAEMLNPLFFFIGIEKLKLFNIANLLSKVSAIALLIFFIDGAKDAIWVNFIMGMATVGTYSYLLYIAIRDFKLGFTGPVKVSLIEIARNNFYLTINNISNNLQQSIIIFALAKWGTAPVLGAYTLCDKVIGSCRILLITVSNAVYPKSAQLYKLSPRLWKRYKKRMQLIITGLFFMGSVLLFIFAPLAVKVLSGEKNDTAILFLRIMALVPTISALNVLNVLDQLLKNHNIYIFRIAMVLLALAVFLALGLLQLTNPLWVGSFTLIIELAGLLMYQYVVTKPAIKHA
jgi:O-antigen/teichoic acid export membrane protein